MEVEQDKSHTLEMDWVRLAPLDGLWYVFAEARRGQNLSCVPWWHELLLRPVTTQHVLKTSQASHCKKYF